jgi:hypothetical protein
MTHDTSFIPNVIENIGKNLGGLLQRCSLPLLPTRFATLESADMLLLHDIGYMLQESANTNISEYEKDLLYVALARECHIRWDAEWRKTQYSEHPERLVEVYDAKRLTTDLMNWAKHVYKELN